MHSSNKNNVKIKDKVIQLYAKGKETDAEKILQTVSLSAVDYNDIGEYIVEVYKKPFQAVKWFRKAADLNNSLAHVNLGKWHYYQSSSFGRDELSRLIREDNFAAMHFDRAHNLDFPIAETYLDKMLDDDNITPRVACYIGRYFEKESSGTAEYKGLWAKKWYDKSLTLNQKKISLSDYDGTLSSLKSLLKESLTVASDTDFTHPEKFKAALEDNDYKAACGYINQRGALGTALVRMYFNSYPNHPKIINEQLRYLAFLFSSISFKNYAALSNFIAAVNNRNYERAASDLTSIFSQIWVIGESDNLSYAEKILQEQQTIQFDESELAVEYLQSDFSLLAECEKFSIKQCYSSLNRVLSEFVGEDILEDDNSHFYSKNYLFNTALEDKKYCEAIRFINQQRPISDAITACFFTSYSLHRAEIQTLLKEMVFNLFVHIKDLNHLYLFINLMNQHNYESADMALSEIIPNRAHRQEFANVRRKLQKAIDRNKNYTIQHKVQHDEIFIPSIVNMVEQIEWAAHDKTLHSAINHIINIYSENNAEKKQTYIAHFNKHEYLQVIDDLLRHHDPNKDDNFKTILMAFYNVYFKSYSLFENQNIQQKLAQIIMTVFLGIEKAIIKTHDVNLLAATIVDLTDKIDQQEFLEISTVLLTLKSLIIENPLDENNNLLDDTFQFFFNQAFNKDPFVYSRDHTSNKTSKSPSTVKSIMDYVEKNDPEGYARLLNNLQFIDNNIVKSLATGLARNIYSSLFYLNHKTNYYIATDLDTKSVKATIKHLNTNIDLTMDNDKPFAIKLTHKTTDTIFTACLEGGAEKSLKSFHGEIETTDATLGVRVSGNEFEASASKKSASGIEYSAKVNSTKEIPFAVETAIKTATSYVKAGINSNQVISAAFEKNTSSSSSYSADVSVSREGSAILNVGKNSANHSFQGSVNTGGDFKAEYTNHHISDSSSTNISLDVDTSRNTSSGSGLFWGLLGMFGAALAYSSDSGDNVKAKASSKGFRLDWNRDLD